MKHQVYTPRVHSREACFTTYLRLWFWGLGPTKALRKNAPNALIKTHQDMRYESQWRVANHNGLDARLLRSSWKTTKAWVANHNGSEAKLLRMSFKIEEKKYYFLIFGTNIFLCSFSTEPIRISNLTLLPRDVCGYAHANMALLPRNQRCRSQKPVLLPFLV